MPRSIPLVHVDVSATDTGDLRIDTVIDAIGAAIEARELQREVRWQRDGELVFDKVPYNHVVVLLRPGTRLDQNRDVLRQGAERLLHARTQDLLGRTSVVAVFESPRSAAAPTPPAGADIFFGEGAGFLPSLSRGMPRAARIFVRGPKAADADPGRDVLAVGPIDRVNASAGLYLGQLGILFSLGADLQAPASAELSPAKGRNRLIYLGKRHLDDTMQVLAVEPIAERAKGWGRMNVGWLKSRVRLRAFDYVESPLIVRALDEAPAGGWGAARWWRQQSWHSVSDVDGELFQFRLEFDDSAMTAYPSPPERGAYFEVTGLHLPDPDRERAVRNVWLNIDDRKLPATQPLEPVKHILAISRSGHTYGERLWHKAQRAMFEARYLPPHELFDAADQLPRHQSAAGVTVQRLGTHRAGAPHSEESQVRPYHSILVGLQMSLYIDMPETKLVRFGHPGLDPGWLDAAVQLELDGGEIIGLGTWFQQRFPQFEAKFTGTPPHLDLFVDETLSFGIQAPVGRDIDFGPLRLKWTVP